MIRPPHFSLRAAEALTYPPLALYTPRLRLPSFISVSPPQKASSGRQFTFSNRT